MIATPVPRGEEGQDSQRLIITITSIAQGAEGNLEGDG